MIAGSAASPIADRLRAWDRRMRESAKALRLRLDRPRTADGPDAATATFPVLGAAWAVSVGLAEGPDLEVSMAVLEALVNDSSAACRC